MKTLSLFAVTAIFSLVQIMSATVVCAQELVGFKRNATMTVAQVNQRINKVFGANAANPTRKAFELYKISYRSVDERNRPVVLTGLIVLPKGGAPKGLVLFNHGTIADRRLSPSRFTGTANSSETEIAALAFASADYAVAMPDYLGFGDHQGAHPYPLSAANSRSAVDMIAPARLLMARQKFDVGGRLFVTGYSEGGAVGMWVMRDLEQKNDAGYKVTSAALASGPYDLSDVTRKWINAAPTDQADFVIRLYLTSYMVDYFHKSIGVKITDYFKPAMALTVSQAYKGNLSDENLIKRLALTAVLMRSKNSLANVITPRFQKALQTLDISDPVIREMQKSDCFDWSPRTKMLLINLKEDKVVDPANTAKAMQTMRRRGVGADTLRQYVIEDRNLTHVTGFAPAMLRARLFFDNGFPN